MSRVSRSRSILAGLALLSVAMAAYAYPKPSPYPTTWELKYKLDLPKRVTVDGKSYWYVTYHVTNGTGSERVFLPLFEMLLPDGKVVRADRLIPNDVFTTIKGKAGYQFLESYNQIASDLRLGEDQSRDGVAIWPETDTSAREFSVFFSGFSGETAKVEGPDKKEVTLFKTLKADYAMGGDPAYRDINQLREVTRDFVMR